MANSNTINSLRWDLGKTKRWVMSQPMVHIYSYGGSGTRMTYEHIKQFITVNGQADVHWRVEKWIPPMDKALFIYGDPREAVMSFFNNYKKGDLEFIKLHSKHLAVPEVPFTTIEEYIDHGKDLFGLERFFDRMINSSARRYDIMAFKYASVWENLDQIMSYIGLEKHIDTFPKKKTRTSKLDELSDENQDRLSGIYSSLIKKQENLPAVSLI